MSDIRNSPSYSNFKKEILNFTRPFSNNVFNVSYPKGLIFLTRLRAVHSHLRKHKFKHSFLVLINPSPICICGFDIETLNHFFFNCPRFINERQNLLNPSRPNPGRREKIKLNFYFNTTFRNAWDVRA